MKIKELIKILKKYPQELDIMLLADEFLCYYPLKRGRMSVKILLLGHNEHDLKRIQQRIKDGNNEPIEPRWREKDWFFGKSEIKEEKKVLTLS